METTAITLRAMRADEYGPYAAEVDAEFAESLAGLVPVEAANERARQGRAQLLPDGLATEGHHLLVVEDADGQRVGVLWVALYEPRTGSTDTAWLCDIRVAEQHRRRGYATAILAAAEELARRAGAARLGLNVFGANRAAIALYQARGYRVTSQQMAKDL